VLTFYTGDTPAKGFDPAPMFTFFLTYIKNVFGFTIDETNENQKEFCTVTDSDGSL